MSGAGLGNLHHIAHWHWLLYIDTWARHVKQTPDADTMVRTTLAEWSELSVPRSHVEGTIETFNNFAEVVRLL